jgi:hypothetical protein
LYDLEKAIKQLSDIDNRIMVALDVNNNLRNGSVKQWMARGGIREVATAIKQTSR